MSGQIRAAQVSDIPHLAYVCMQATGGIFEALYEGSIPNRETHLIIEHMFSRLDSTSSFRNCRMLEANSKVVGALHGFAADRSAQDPGDPLVRRDRLHVVAPFIELSTPPGSYYISSVGLYPDERGHGFGRALMQDAEATAESLALNSMSLHVFEQNRPAVTLYHSMGYEAIGRSPVIPHPLIRYEGELLLMAKSLGK